MRNEAELDTEYKRLFCEYCGIQLLYDRHQIAEEIFGGMIVATFWSALIGMVIYSGFRGLLLALIPILICFYFSKKLRGRFF